jgi:hypothetical protein
VVKYFSGSLHEQKPFYDDDEYLEILSINFKDLILNVQEELKSSKKNKEYFEHCLEVIERKESINISGKKYTY